MQILDYTIVYTKEGLFMNYNKIIRFIIVAVILTLTFAILLNLDSVNTSSKHHRIIPTIIEEE